MASTAFMAVGKGSDKEPQFVIMQYEPEQTSAKTKARRFGREGHHLHGRAQYQNGMVT
jgi:hypothetical protein